MATTVIRSDVVGSLLRPDDLKAARQRWKIGQPGAAEFKRIADRAVDEAVALQEGGRGPGRGCPTSIRHRVADWPNTARFANPFQHDSCYSPICTLGRDRRATRVPFSSACRSCDPPRGADS